MISHVQLVQKPEEAERFHGYPSVARGNGKLALVIKNNAHDESGRRVAGSS